MTDRLRREDGQVLPLLAVGLLAVLLGFAALAVDLGHAYLVKRQLQATADAAALAGAGQLPDVATALTTASTYGPEDKNPVQGVDVTQATRATCLRTTPSCVAGRETGLVVTETASVPTAFAKVLGIDSIDVSAKATACGMCGSAPLDIALVLDRTGSMDQSGSMPALRDGVKAFLQSLDPARDYVTLLVFPPTGSADVCSAPQAWSGGSFFGQIVGSVFYPPTSSGTYTVVRMSHDYKTGTALNTSSPLVRAVDCLKAGGPTAYKEALMAAQDELVNHGSGRPDVKRAIVFETDGAANTVPWSWMNAENFQPASGHDDDFARPCGSAADYVDDVVKPSGTLVYTVAYALSADEDCYQAPHVTSDHRLVGYRTLYGVREPVSAGTVLTQMASEDGAYTAATQSAMNTAFQQVGAALMSASLVSDDDAD